MSWFQQFAQEYAVYGYPVLFCGVLAENAGVPVPGETAVLVAGFLSSPAGGGHFDILWVICLTFLAAVIGDNLGFWVGERFARPYLRQGRRFLFLTPKTLELAEGYFTRYGIWTIFFARFITGLRVVGAIAAGTAGMPWPKFLVANAGGALSWAVAISLLGYFFGHSWELMHKWLGRGGLILLGCVIVFVGLPILLRHVRSLPSRFWDRLARAQIWEGLLVAVLEIVCIALLVLLAQNTRPVNRLDRHIDEWVGETAPSMPFLHAVAAFGSALGTLPVVATAVGLHMIALWMRHRNWRECVALIWCLVASEVIGFILLGLFRARDIEPIPAPTWPRGFAGLVPIRVLAVFGMMHALLRLYKPWARILTGFIAIVLILLPGFSVVWSQSQAFTETILEYAAGGVILFVGIWWLEGFGPGLWTLAKFHLPLPPTSHATTSSSGSKRQTLKEE
ncbi:MAG TPA: DedA family protein [Gemmataceae bacterium]|nr:DedA family protein [Gemmataceae bacterium]